MGEAVDRLRSKAEAEDMVSLSFLSRVKSHKRTTKTGKVVDVAAYTRKLSGMSLPELATELREVKDDRTRAAQVANEIRRRETQGPEKRKLPSLREEARVARERLKDPERGPGPKFYESQALLLGAAQLEENIKGLKIFRKDEPFYSKRKAYEKRLAELRSRKDGD